MVARFMWRYFFKLVVCLLQFNALLDEFLSFSVLEARRKPRDRVIGDQSGSGKVAGEGRREETGTEKSKDDEGGSVRLAKNPYIIVRGYWRLAST
jgi:hypothetical protein